MLNISARFNQRDPFDPIHPVDAAIARIAIGAQEFVHIAWASIIGRDCQRVAAAEVVHHPGEIAIPQHLVIARIGGQRLMIIFHGHLACLLTRGAGHQLHQSARAGVTDGIHRKLAFLPGNRVDHRPVAALDHRHLRKGDRLEIAEAVGMRRLAKDYGQVAAAELARKIRHQQMIALGHGLVRNLAEKAHCSRPVSLARHFAHRQRQRLGLEYGALTGRGDAGGGRVKRR